MLIRILPVPVWYIANATVSVEENRRAIGVACGILMIWLMRVGLDLAKDLWEVKTEEAKEFAGSVNAEFYEASAVTGESIDAIFENIGTWAVLVRTGCGTGAGA